MIENHIPFEKLSDFCDDEVIVQEERKELLEHMQKCHFCKSEFHQLQSMISYCSDLRKTFICAEDFVKKTMAAIKWRHRRRTLLTHVPVAAASVVLIGGVALFASIINAPAGHDTGSFAIMPPSPLPLNTAASDTENVVGILSANSASIFKVSDLFIEGEIAAERFAKLRRELGFRKVFYRVGSRPKQQGAAANPYLEEVGSVSGSGEQFSLPARQGEYVHFRIFK
ncbi:MAG: hypothetical protein LBT84_02730 [Spirochaetia bacterium]|jgi:hypothetical protein|nr:hypothetical protein [Spirochaetia bacterium]